MNRRTVLALNAINERFYRSRAEEFSATRERPWRGWQELFERHPELIDDRPSVLDVGCGNGRFARYLEAGFACYDGVDGSLLAIEEARRRLSHLRGVRLHEHDFVTAFSPLPEALDGCFYDLVVLFGVLHHVPGAENRSRLVNGLSRHVSPRGALVYSVWRFDRYARFRKKLVPWEEFLARTGCEVDPAELESGDHIMTWGAGSEAFRYCHALGDDEAGRLAADAPLDLVDSLDADDGLNRYYVLKLSENDPRRASE